MKKRVMIFLILAVLLVIGIFCVTDFTKKPVEKEIPSPFDISVTDIKVYPDASTEEKPEVKDGHRLSLDVSIENNTEEEFEDVWYKITLNEETEPYIASKILEWTSDKMDVTTKEKAKKSGKDSLNVWGLEHTWEMLLTTDEDLQEYDISENRIDKVLNTVTVEVFWKGGEQKEEIPVKVTDIEW